MKKILIITLTVSIFGMLSCTKDITRFNDQTKRAEIVPAETLFSNATKNYVDVLASCNVNLNVFRFTVQHWAATTYQDEPQYDFSTRAIPDALWTRMYRLLGNLNDSKRIINADSSLLPAVRANKLAICDIMQVNAYYFLVTSFGNVPYTDALDYNKVFAKYDDAKTVYNDLIKRMQTNVAALNTAAVGITASQDILFSGNVSSWKKFANSILLRMAITIADSDPAQAQSVFEAADAGAFMAAKDIAQLKYLSANPNTNPLYVDLVQSKRQDMVAGRALLDTLKAMSDPRLSLYFRKNNDSLYVGGVVGQNNTFSTVAKPSAQMALPTFPQIVLGYSEVEFMRAEAIERGYNISGTAADHYKNAIIASVNWWGGSDADAAAYVARPDVDYATTTGEWKQKIGFQKWIGLYNQPVQGWVEMRRLDQPHLSAPVGAKSGFPNRLPYSQGEQNLNPVATAVGGDKVETKLFWDKY